MIRPERDEPAFDSLDVAAVDRIRRDMLDQDAWSTPRLIGLAGHYVERLQVDDALGRAECRDPTVAMTLVCALRTIAGRPAGVDSHRRRERLFVRATPVVCDDVANFLGATLRRDRMRLGLSTGVSRALA